jgi:hypothetical protein
MLIVTCCLLLLLGLQQSIQGSQPVDSELLYINIEWAYSEGIQSAERKEESG